ncbi:MAG: hypothetical protein MRZ93_01320 [Lachnospiraceae bacterium]|nr:hypothetical protein [Lachnospiraceae bacterium]
MEEMIMESQKEKISKAFKSMIKSGRPEIRDDENEDLVEKLYVDLLDGEYYLNLAMDDNHTIFKGRRGTGKSTIFIQAEKKLAENKGILPVYINLQTCYEVIRSSDSEQECVLSKWTTYKNFFNEVLGAIDEKCKKWFRNNRDIQKLFEDIKNGEYIDADFERSVRINEGKETEFIAGGGFELKGKTATANVTAEGTRAFSKATEHNSKEIRIYSINKILKRLTEILEKQNINKVYLFLDDFSELEKEAQQLVIDSLVAPIISSYNKYFVIKLAAYPYRIYLGNMDSNKISQYSLDFYNVYEKTANNYKEVETLGIDYVRRTLKKRIEVFTNGQFDSDELFDVQKNKVEEYYKRLFYASAGIPRCLGYILDYSFVASINQGKVITMSNIDNAAKQYYTENIYPDFFNDVRYKQSFFDDDRILSRIAQNNLMQDLIRLSKEFKRSIVQQYTGKCAVKEIYKDTLVKYKTTNGFWLPSSHFFINKESEDLLQTLELYYIVNKFNEGSTRKKASTKVSFYGLNYGLCLENGIDYGKPEFRRSYDYWRQEEFDYSKIIPTLLLSSSVPKCQECGYEYMDREELKMAQKFQRCLKCGKENAISESSAIEKVLLEEIEKWRAISLPDSQMEVLRILYNNRDSLEEMTAARIAVEMEKHHLAITKYCDKLKRLGYVDYSMTDRRVYKITQKAIDTYFEQKAEGDEEGV